MRLDDLPPELLRDIVDRIQQVSPDDLLSLKLVNKTISAIAHRVTTGTVTLLFQDPDQFGQQVSLLRQQLERAECPDAVHTLIIADAGTFSRSGHKQTTACRTLLHNEEFNIDKVDRELREHSGDIWTCPAEVEHWRAPNHGWHDLALLLPLLTRLRWLSCTCMFQLAPVVLQALESTACSQVQVEVRSLSFGQRGKRTFDPPPAYELFRPLASLAGLRSIRLLLAATLNGAFCDIRDQYEWLSRELLLVLLYMPQITRLSLHIDNIEGDRDNVPTPYIEELIKSCGEQRSKIALDVLHLHCTTQNYRDILHFHRWTSLADWQFLSELTITYHLSVKELSHITKLEFKSLRRLYLLAPTRSDGDGRFPEDMVHSPRVLRLLREWLSHLPPLKSLTLHGSKDAALISIIAHRHGQTLIELDLNFPDRMQEYCLVLTREQVEMLSRQCLKLECLSITVARTNGDASEATIYALLGRLPMLHTLHITLCIWPRHFTDLAHEDFTTRRAAEQAFGFDHDDAEIVPHISIILPLGRDDGVTRGELRHIVRNLVIDQGLAVDISSGVLSQRPDHCSQSLELHLHHFYPDSLYPVCTGLLSYVFPLLQRSWIVRQPGGRPTQVEPIWNDWHNFRRIENMSLGLRNLESWQILDSLLGVWPELSDMLGSTRGYWSHSYDFADLLRDEASPEDVHISLATLAELPWTSIKSQPLSPPEEIAH